MIFPKNSPKGTVIGRVAARDEDLDPAQDVLEYTIFNKDGTELSDLFKVDNGARLVLATNYIFNFEEKDSVSVIINVNDTSSKFPGALSANATFTIHIRDVPERPRWPNPAFFSAV